MPESPTDLPRGYQYPEHSVVRADPSALTVAMLERAVAQLREFYDAQLGSLKDELKTAHEDFTRVPTLLDRAVLEMKELFDVKISDIKELLAEKIAAAAHVRQEQFHALDVQLQARAERARDLDAAREQALNHALAAAKELVAAANSNFTEQIKGLQTSTGNQITSLDAKVNDLRDQLTRFSSTMQGGVDAHAQRRADSGSFSAMVTALIAVLGFALTIGTVVLTRPPSPSPTISYAPAPTAVPAPVTVPR